MNYNNIIAKILLYHFPLLLLISCSKDEAIIRPINLPDKIPYDELGSGKLIFNRNEDNFFLIDIDEQSVSSLAIDPIGGCILSPDGEMIAYSTYMDILHLININGSPYKEFSYTNQCFGEISWSPDSKKIIYLDQCYTSPDILYEIIVGDDCCDNNTIRSFSSTNTYEFLSPFSMSLNGDITFYYYSSDQGQISGLFIMNENGQDLKCISSKDSYFRYGYCSPSWSPSGDKIAYLSLNDTNIATQWIILIDPIGLNTDTIAEFNVPPNAFTEGWGARNRGLSLCWAPDGTKIVFTKLEGNDVAHIYLIDINTRDISQITFEEDVRDYFVSWAK